MTTPSWVRSQRATVVDVGHDCLLIERSGAIRKLEGDSAELARAVLAFAGHARTEAQIIAHVEALAGPLRERRDVVRQLVALLAEVGALATGDMTTAMRLPATRGANVVVGITGAIAASHAPALIAALQHRGHTVEVAVTPTAARFVAQDALAALVRREIHTSMWPAAAHAPVPHIALAEWADLVVIYPASATTIARLAAGDCSELVAAISLATRAPVVIVPSMNDAMASAPAMLHNLERLRDDGRAIVHGVPSVEAADAPQVRAPAPGAAPAPSEVAATLDALLAAGQLPGRADPSTTAMATAEHGAGAGPGAHAWNAAYRGPLVPWASDTCDPDMAKVLAEHAPRPARVLDVGCGLGQVARHAAASGHRVVAIEVSEVALARACAHDAAAARDIVWLRDDVCASALIGPFDVIVDRATLHALPASRVHAWAAAIDRLAGPSAIVIVKCHRDSIPGATLGYDAARLAALLPAFDVVSAQSAELPHPRERATIPASLVVLRRKLHA